MPSTSVQAQEILSKIFEKATDISPFAQAAWLSSDTKLGTRGSSLFGYGIEILFSVADNPRAAYSVELALGYNYLTGFRSADPAIDLRGSMRTLPELSVYATYERPGRIEPYVGVHTGLLDLWHVQAYDAERVQYSVDSESFQAGVTAGAVWRGVWLEGSYRVRNFPSLEWELPEGTTALPGEFPRSLDLSGWNLRVGYQFSIGNDPKN
ncbi:MAG: hypothetical protein H0U59_13680 [Gemmatimonadaceae bacterium]|nr:hypothetical protein [Gemmatimonadaceae bacterium]MDQ3243406.1 hypothetical protein [Gemmatimonadota bacterium]